MSTDNMCDDAILLQDLPDLVVRKVLSFLTIFDCLLLLSICLPLDSILHEILTKIKCPNGTQEVCLFVFLSCQLNSAVTGSGR